MRSDITISAVNLGSGEVTISSIGWSLSLKKAKYFLSPNERPSIGQKLAELGDPRPGVGLHDGLPDLAWVDVPPGSITLEGVDRLFKVKLFRMAKYLVTNAQSEAFLRADDGYKNKKWRKGMTDHHWDTRPSWREANAPRETVSWENAVAFCGWLSHRTDSTIRLPTEWEWQKAATGGDPTREYPWPGKWDATR